MSDHPLVEIDPALCKILDGEHRSSEHKARDVFRHPAKTFSFFGLKESSIAVDVWPGSKGWTTEILAPYLKEKGHYIAASYDPPTETSFDASKSQKQFEEKLATAPDLYGAVEMGRISPSVFDFGSAESVDLIIALRVHHIFMLNDYLDAITNAFFQALKPGGVLGVVEHREDPERPLDTKGSRGYVHESYVIDCTTKTGFTHEASSEINANPKDTKDYPQSVWSLPPWMVKVAEEEKGKYQAIGESDRMTLKFRKPNRS